MPRLLNYDLDAHIGAKIKELRKNYGLSQPELGERLNVSWQQIQKYEKGENAVKASTLFEISSYFGVDFGYFTEEFTNNGKSLRILKSNHKKAIKAMLIIDKMRERASLVSDFVRVSVRDDGLGIKIVCLSQMDYNDFKKSTETRKKLLEEFGLIEWEIAIKK